MTSDPISTPHHFATARGAAMLALLIGSLCWVSISYTRQVGGLSNLWMASGVLTGVLLTTQRSRWNVYIVAALAGNLAVRILLGDAPPIASILAATSTFDAAAVAFLVRHFVGDVANTSKITSIAKTATAASLAACAASALCAALAGMIFLGHEFFAPFATWFAVHSIGMVIFATLTVVARLEGKLVFGRRGKRTELFLLIGLVAATSLGVFAQSRYPLLFLIMPILLLASFRHRFSGFVLGTTVVCIIAMIATISGNGPTMLSADATPAERTFVLQLFIAAACALTLPIAVVLTHRRWLEHRLSSSESDYRMLAEYSRDMVVRIDSEGNRKFVSPAASEILGWNLDEMREERWDLVHPDDRSKLMVAMAKLRVEGGSATIDYRVQHRDGHFVWIEAQARLVPSSDPGQPPDIIYSGRDISRRIKAEQDLARNQRRLRAIADNTPAMVIQINTEERYTFANAYAGQTLGMHPSALIGRSLKEIADPKVYEEIKPYIDAALRGESVAYESQRDYAGEQRYFQCTYIPDRAPTGEVVGFYGMVFDVTKLKRAEHQLTQLARHDALTGLANRLQFNERVTLAAARRQRTPSPIALLYLDIDRFKEINDTMGHAAGDAILVAFAERLRGSVRETDLVARLGGDEFVVLVEELDSSAVAETIARNLIASLADGIDVNGTNVTVTTSIGIAFRDGAIASGDELIKLADDALYAAKAAGRNTYRVAI
ncbi:MAG: diguanylate cyclase [Rudaea sp.]